MLCFLIITILASMPALHHSEAFILGPLTNLQRQKFELIERFCKTFCHDFPINLGLLHLQQQLLCNMSCMVETTKTSTARTTQTPTAGTTQTPTAGTTKNPAAGTTQAPTAGTTKNPAPETTPNGLPRP